MKTSKILSVAGITIVACACYYAQITITPEGVVFSASVALAGILALFGAREAQKEGY